MGIEKLDKYEKVKLVLDNNRRWEIMKTKVPDLCQFLSNGELTDENFPLSYSSLNLVLSELYINEEEYSKFPTITYNFDDFSHLILESKKNPEDFIYKTNDEIYKNIQNLREKVWGYAKNDHQDFINFFIDFVEAKKSKEKITNLIDERKHLLVICSLIIFVECVLREQERKLLEKTYQ